MKIGDAANYDIHYEPGTLSVVWWYCPPGWNNNSRASAYNNPIVSRSADPTSNSLLAINQLTQSQKTITFKNGNNGIMAVQSNSMLSKDNVFDETYTTSIFPNPTHGTVTINVNNASLSNKGIIITDLLGKVYSSGSVRNVYANSVVLDMSGFKSGIYFIRIKIDGTYKTFRIIKL